MKRTIRPALSHYALLSILSPAIGAVLGLIIGFLFELAISSPWLTIEGVFGFGQHVGEPILLWITTIIGGLGGAVFAATMLGEALQINISEREIEISWDNARVLIPAEMIQSIVVDSDIVILGKDCIELARVRNDVNSTSLIDALTDLDYQSVLTRDPYEQEFRPEHDKLGLETDAQKLLAARAHAIRIGAHGDAELLRRRLVSRGIMVRDVHRRGMRPLGQQWRRGHAQESFPEFAFGV